LATAKKAELDSSSTAPALSDLLWQPISVRRATTIAAEILAALVALHGRDESHGHLQPALIRLVATPHGTESATLLPFEMMICTLDNAESQSGYRAPERLHGAPPSVQADLFAVGAIVHEMVTGRSPQPIVDDGNGNLHGPAFGPLPQQARSLEPWLARMTDADPCQRFGTAQEALTALDSLGAPAEPPPGFLPQLAKPRVDVRTPAELVGDADPTPIPGSTAHRLWGVAALLLVGLVVAGGFGLRSAPALDRAALGAALIPASVVPPLPERSRPELGTELDPEGGPDLDSDHEVEPRRDPARAKAKRSDVDPDSTAHLKTRTAKKSTVRASSSRSRTEQSEPVAPLPIAEPLLDPVEPRAVTEEPVERPRSKGRTRTPGKVRMSAEEADAWSHTRSGKPGLVVRRPSSPPTTPAVASPSPATRSGAQP